MEHTQEFIDLVESARQNIAEVSVAETIEHMKKGAKLIDVREDNEWEKGHARGLFI